MSTDLLQAAKDLADQLSPREQAELIQHLASRVAEAVAPPAKGDGALDYSWQRFFDLGDQLAAEDLPDLPTITSTLLSMRR